MAETYSIMNGSEIMHGFSKEREDCKFKTNRRKYYFMGHMKMKTIEMLPQKTECIKRLEN